MRLSERLDNLLRQYSYRRKRGHSHKNEFKFESYIDEIDSYLKEVMEEIEDMFNKP